MSRRSRPLHKRQMKALQEAARILEKAASDAFAALWYFECDAWKGHSWGYTSVQEAKAALVILEKLFPTVGDEGK